MTESSSNDPTKQFSLSVKVCRKIASTLDQMLQHDREIAKEEWESIRQSAKDVVEMAEREPTRTDPVPVQEEPDTIKEPTPRTGSPAIWAAVFVSLCTLAALLWVVFDLRDLRREMKLNQAAEPQTALAVATKPAEPAKDIPEEPVEAAPPENLELDELDLVDEEEPSVLKFNPGPKKKGGKRSRWGSIDVGFPESWAFVYVDGRKIRSTPLFGHRVRSGKHKIELKDKEGRTIRKWNIRVDPGDRVRLLHQHQAVGQGDPDGAYGFLVANTKPVAKVSVDDKYIGRSTPITYQRKLRLSVGRHKIAFEIPSGEIFTFDVVIEKGKTLKLLKRLSSTVEDMVKK